MEDLGVFTVTFTPIMLHWRCEEYEKSSEIECKVVSGDRRSEVSRQCPVTKYCGYGNELSCYKKWGNSGPV